MKRRSSAAHAARSELLADARFLSTTRFRIRRSATTGSFFGSNLTKKMPQGWLVDSGRSRLISWIFAALGAVDPELLRRVVERQLVEVRRVDRPVHLVSQVAISDGKRADLPELGALRRRHRAQPSFSSIQHLRAGLTPIGASTRLRYVFLMCFSTCRSQLDERLLLCGALARGLGVRPDAVDDLLRLLEDRRRGRGREVPAGGPGLFGELALLLVQRRQRVAEEDAADALAAGRFRPLKIAPGSRSSRLSSSGSSWIRPGTRGACPRRRSSCPRRRG